MMWFVYLVSSSIPDFSKNIVFFSYYINSKSLWIDVAEILYYYNASIDITFEFSVLASQTLHLFEILDLKQMFLYTP